MEEGYIGEFQHKIVHILSLTELKNFNICMDLDISVMNRIGKDVIYEALTQLFFSHVNIIGVIYESLTQLFFSHVHVECSAHIHLDTAHIRTYEKKLKTILT